MSETTTEQSIFLRAIALPSSAERAAYLEEACRGKPELRAGVDALLAAHERLGGEAPPTGTGLPDAQTAATGGHTPPAEMPGTVIGPYKLLERIGEGGMGTVWMAQQTAPVKRLVALKLVKAGMDSRQVIARFEAERQALALMDHPNIARVLDGGTTASGRPYIVMDLVKGKPITEYCDEHHLTPRQRLELFVPVCQAVQHAHQKGVIHRDIKPSNVLVALYDGQPVPKVIDFGIAKAARQPLTEQTLVTGFGAIVGTLEYMSPEQAEINQLDIDTRSDIYSLGVLLYELLTGTTPLEHKRVKESGLIEALRIIREEEVPTLSNRLGTTAELSVIATNRGLEPAKLTKLVRGELDWIVLKALEKDRSRRYETATGLAADVERYLADEPVIACPPSFGYRARKFVRRNRRVLVTAAVLAVALVVGIGAIAGSIGWAARDRAARQAAVEHEAAQAFDDAERWMEQEKWPEALDAVKRGQGVLAGSGGEVRDLLRDLRKDLEMVIRLENVRLLVIELQSGWHEWDAVHDGYAEAFADYGINVLNLPAEEAAARIRARGRLAVPLAVALDLWACADSPRTRENEARLRSVAGLVDPDPWRRQVREAVQKRDGAALARLADSPDLVRQSRDSLAVLQRGLRFIGGHDQKAYDVLRLAQLTYPGDFWATYWLAHDLYWLHPDSDEVLSFARAAVAIRPKGAGTRLLLGLALQKRGRYDEAVAHLRKAVELAPANPFAHHDLGWTLHAQGKYGDAISCYEKAIDLWPENPHAYGMLGDTLVAQNKPVEAVAAFRKAIEFDPKDAFRHYNLGRALRQQGNLEEAIAAYRKAIELKSDFAGARNNLDAALDECIARDEKAVELNREDARAHNNLGASLHNRKKLDMAVAAFRKAIELDPKFATAYSNLGVVLREQNKLDEAIACFTNVIELDPIFATAYQHRAHAYAALGQWEKAAADLESILKLDPQFHDAWRFAAYANLAAGDTASYRRTCRELVERFGQTDNPVLAERTAKVCSVAPGSVADFGVVERLAQVAVTGTEQHGDYHYFVLAKGLTEGRAGRHAEAVQWLERFAPNAGRGWHIDAIAFAALALAQHRLGRTDEAKLALGTAKYIVAEKGPDPSKGRLFAGDWHDWLHAQMLSREAEGLIGEISRQELAALRQKRWDRELDQLPHEPHWDSARMRLCREIAGDAELFAALQKLRPDDADLSIARGQILAQAQKWDEAAEWFGRVIDRRGLSEDAFQFACLHLLTDRPDAYRQFCTNLIGQAGEVTDPHVAFVLARTCILVPEMAASPEQVVSWAERAVSRERLPWHLHVLGAAWCRAGQYGRAIELLEESTARKWNVAGEAQNALVLAIAHQRQGNSMAAAECLDRARTLMAGVDRPPPPDWLEYHVLVREAEALIEARP